MASQKSATTQNFLLVGALGLVVGVIAAVTIVKIRPNADNTALIVVIFGFIGTATTQVYSLLKNSDAAATVIQKTEDTHALVDGQMQEFKATLKTAAVSAVSAAHAAGAEAGMIAGALAANTRTDELQSQHDAASVAGGRRADDVHDR